MIQKKVSKSIIGPLCRSIENIRDSRTGISSEPKMKPPRLNSDKKRTEDDDLKNVRTRTGTSEDDNFDRWKIDDR